MKLSYHHRYGRFKRQALEAIGSFRSNRKRKSEVDENLNVARTLCLLIDKDRHLGDFGLFHQEMFQNRLTGTDIWGISAFFIRKCSKIG